MSQPDLEPLAPELLRLLAAERSRPAPPASMQARVLERIGSDLLANIPLAGPPSAGIPATHPLSRILPSRLHRLPLMVGVVAGGLSGAGLHALLQKNQHTVPLPVIAPLAPAPFAVPTVPPDLQSALVDSAPPGKTEPRPEPRIPVRRQVPSVPPAVPPANDDHRLARDGELGAERALLEQARTALARGKPADALVLLSRHEREFAKGRLMEERQALTILSLAANHQMDAARSNASKFRREFPKSMLLRTVDAAVETSP